MSYRALLLSGAALAVWAHGLVLVDEGDKFRPGDAVRF